MIIRSRELTTHKKLGRYQRLLFILVFSELALGTCHVQYEKKKRVYGRKKNFAQKTLVAAHSADSHLRPSWP